MYLSKSGCNQEKVAPFRQKLLYSDKLVLLGQKRLYSGNVSFSGKVVVLGQKWLYSG